MIRARQSKSAPVGVVSKVLRVFEALSASPEGLALKDVAQRTGINKSTAYRFLAHLEFEGYLFRDDRGAYVVGPKLVRLGSGVSYQTSLRKISRPVLQDLWKDHRRNREPRDARRAGRVLSRRAAEPASISDGVAGGLVAAGLLHGDGKSAGSILAAGRKRTRARLAEVRTAHAAHDHATAAASARTRKYSPARLRPGR